MCVYQHGRRLPQLLDLKAVVYEQEAKNKTGLQSGALRDVRRVFVADADDHSEETGDTRELFCFAQQKRGRHSQTGRQGSSQDDLFRRSNDGVSRRRQRDEEEVGLIDHCAAEIQVGSLTAGTLVSCVHAPAEKSGE